MRGRVVVHALSMWRVERPSTRVPWRWRYVCQCGHVGPSCRDQASAEAILGAHVAIEAYLAWVLAGRQLAAL